MTGAVALTLLSTMTMAEGKGLYVGGGIVYEKFDELEDAGQALELHVGKEIANNFGAELRISKTFNEAKESGSVLWANGYFPSTQKVDMTTMGAFGTYTYSPIPQLSIVPKLGFNYISTKSTLTADVGSATVNKDETGTRFAYSLDVKYNINSKLTTYIGFSHIASDIQHISFGLESHF